MSTPFDPYQTFAPLDEEPTISLAPGMSLAGRYTLIKQIGRSGMGVVWSAEERAAGRKVVLKFVPRELKNFEFAVAQLKESFQKIHDLQHQHICPVYTLEEDFSLGYYLVMKCLDGETLDEYIVRSVGRRQPLPFDEVLRILRPVAEALDCAHGQRIIHRDIKPSNIFILLDEEKAMRDVQVIDFDLASEIRSSLTRVSQVRFDTSGTRPYMAPEQWRARPQSGPTDQYALAVVAYELFSGYLPFDGADIQMLGNAVLNFPPEPIREMSEQVNAALLKALAKDGSERFENCVKFVAALGGAEISVVSKASSVPTPKTSSGSSPPSPTPIAPGVESLMKRAHLFLEDSDWQQANDYFDRVLDIDPEYAPAYTGKLCAELMVQKESLLGDHDKPISEHNNFKKAVRFADEEYKTKLEGYDEKIRERIRQEEERFRLEKYDWLLQAKDKASNEMEYQELAKECRSMNGYKDTAKLATECDKAALELRYRCVCEETKRALTEADWQQLAFAFRAMDGYRNTADLAGQCETQHRKLRARREEEEQLRLRRPGNVAGERGALTIQGVEYAFRWCPSGTFTMGSPAGHEIVEKGSLWDTKKVVGSEAARSDSEIQHQVTLTRGFWMLETQVTQEMWESVMGSNPSRFKGDKRLPVEMVRWENCQAFIGKLNESRELRSRIPGFKFSLPTESQWEYACRAGTTMPFHFGSVLNGDKANCDGNYPYGTDTKGRNLDKTSVVGSYPANAWGLYDMHGNVWEWCSDRCWAYPSDAVIDPVGPSTSGDRVIRGGSWNFNASCCRSATRFWTDPSSRYYYLGFRLSLVSESE